jgi:hypothetical protein
MYPKMRGEGEWMQAGAGACVEGRLQGNRHPSTLSSLLTSAVIARTLADMLPCNQQIEAGASCRIAPNRNKKFTRRGVRKSNYVTEASVQVNRAPH